ncbi:MAG: hypothetical protein Q7N87_05265 [Candidatus Uhrbacteria bacterium]|nr:hypothetical protein [Candidatus Uhrbacteria bacterium]
MYRLFRGMLDASIHDSTGITPPRFVPPSLSSLTLSLIASSLVTTIEDAHILERHNY